MVVVVGFVCCGVDFCCCGVGGLVVWIYCVGVEC